MAVMRTERARAHASQRCRGQRVPLHGMVERRDMAAASAVGFRPGNTRPVTPSVTSSWWPDSALTSTGKPAAMASSTATDSFGTVGGTTSRSAASSRSSVLSNSPGISTRPDQIRIANPAIQRLALQAIAHQPQPRIRPLLGPPASRPG